MLNFLTVLIALNTLTPFSNQTVTLWSWDRFDDFTFIRSHKVTLAPLIATFKAQGKGPLKVELRHQRFKRPSSIDWIAVFRIEMPSDRSMSDTDMGRIVSVIKTLSKGSKEIQLDFDAQKSQRSVYKKLAETLNQHVSLPLSMTALASWCTYDTWLDDMPVLYAVPMVYNLGEEKELIKHYLKKNKEWGVRKCRGHLGLSLLDLSLLDDWEIVLKHRLYFFNHQSWTASDLTHVLKRGVYL